MKNWRAVRKELNDSRLDYYDAQDESPLQKLIDQRRYDEIKDAVLDYMTEKVKENKATLSDIEIQNVVHIEQVDDGAISFSVIVSCDIQHSISSTGRVSFTEKWIDVRCKVLLGVELTDFEIINAWIESGFSEELIEAALKEAVYNGALTLRYVDKVLYEWNRKGIKVPADIKKAMEKVPEAPLYEASVMNFDWLNEK